MHGVCHTTLTGPLVPSGESWGTHNTIKAHEMDPYLVYSLSIYIFHFLLTYE